jgi:hypothetical protein
LAGDWEGNCDGCFLKRQGSLVRMTIDHPDNMGWWAEQERRAKARGYTYGQFRSPDRESYAQIAERVRREPTLPGAFLDPDDTGLDVFADCEGGCGV